MDIAVSMLFGNFNRDGWRAHVFRMTADINSVPFGVKKRQWFIIINPLI